MTGLVDIEVTDYKGSARIAVVPVEVDGDVDFDDVFGLQRSSVKYS